MTTREPALPIGLLAALIAFGIVPRCPAQEPSTAASLQQRDEPRTSPLEEAIQKFAPHRKVIARSLARIEAVGATVHRNPSIGFEKVIEIPIGVITAIVIDPLPIFVVPESLAEPRLPPNLNNRGAPPPDDGKVPVGSLGMRYRLIDEAGNRVPLVEIDRSRPLSLIYFALEDRAQPPAEIRTALTFPAEPRRIQAGESFAVTLFRDPVADALVVTVPGRLDEGAETFVRPALVRVSPSAVGSPLFSTSGEWLGIVNRTPSGEKHEKVRYEKPDVRELSPARDPAEWTFGNRWPILMSVVELREEFERVRAAATAPRVFDALGLTLVDKDGGAHVAATSDVAGMFAIDPPLAPNDRIVSLGGKAVATVLGFERALEAALAASEGPHELEFERAGETSTAALRFRG